MSFGEFLIFASAAQAKKDKEKAKKEQMKKAAEAALKNKKQAT